MTALSLFYSNQASATLATANQLYVLQGTPVTTNHDTTIGTASGWGEEFAQGSVAAWPAGGSIANPSGNGFFLDPSVLSLVGLQLLAGTYTGAVAYRVAGSGATSIVATLHLRLFKYNTVSLSYTAIVDLSLTAKTITTSIVTQTFSGSTNTPTSFAANDVAYLDLPVDITTPGGVAAETLRIGNLSTDTVGLTGHLSAALVTPGFAGAGGAGALYLPHRPFGRIQ